MPGRLASNQNTNQYPIRRCIMKTATFFLTVLFMFGSSMGYADTMNTIQSPSSAFADWTAGDHMGAAKRYEEEARLLQAEARGMEAAENRILPYLEVEAVEMSGLPKIIDRRMKESEEKMKLASWHHQEAMRLIALREASEGPKTSVKGVGTSVKSKDTYMKYEWLQDEDVLGW